MKDGEFWFEVFWGGEWFVFLEISVEGFKVSDEGKIDEEGVCVVEY